MDLGQKSIFSITFRCNECQDDAFVLKARKSFLLAKLLLMDKILHHQG